MDSGKSEYSAVVQEVMQRWSVSEYDVDGASQIKLHVLLYMPPSQKYSID